MRIKMIPTALEWPSVALEPVPACPICQSTERSILYLDLIDDTFFAAPGKWRMMKCAACASTYLDPRPVPESISVAYAAYYTHGSSAVRVNRGIKAFAKSALKRLSDSYVASLTNPERSVGGLSKIATGLVKAVPPCRQVIDARYRHLRYAPVGADRLLDIGCGGGDFLKRAESLGWKAEGVDFDPQAVSTARAAGLNVSIGSIESYKDVSEEFDVITCNHVIEHVYDPVELVAAMHRILKRGGELWIETPNVGSTGHKLFGKSWRGLEAPRHIAIFNHRSLMDTLTAAGFSITHETPWNFQHIRQVFASSEAMRAGEDPHNTRTPLVPNWRLVQGLVAELFRTDRREFVCLRATKKC